MCIYVCILYNHETNGFPLLNNNRAVTKQYMIAIGTCTGVTARIEKAQMDGSNRVVLHSVQFCMT